MLFDLVRLGGMELAWVGWKRMKVGFDEKNCAYGKQDSNVFVDK